MIKRLMLALALLLPAPAPAWAELQLKTAAIVDAGVVRVGDLFDGAGGLATREVGPAPAPGMTAVYQANHLAAIARAYGLDWQPASAGQSVRVSRTDSAGAASDVGLMVVTALQDQGIDGDLQVTLGRLPALAAGRRDVELRDLRVDIKTGRFTASLRQAGQDGVVAINGRYETVLQATTTTRTIARGNTIAAGDVTEMELRVAGSPGHLMTRLDEVVGKEVQRTLRPGKPIGSADVAEPAMINKGGLVTMTLTAPGMVLTGTARALGDGRLGDTIQIMNLRSKRTIEGTIVGADLVEVQMGRQIATSAAR